MKTGSGEDPGKISYLVNLELLTPAAGTQVISWFLCPLYASVEEINYTCKNSSHGSTKI